MKDGFTSGQLQRLRTRPQSADWYVAIHRPPVMDRFIIQSPETLTASAIAVVPAYRWLPDSATLEDINGSRVKAGMTGIVWGANFASKLGEVRIRQEWNSAAVGLHIMESGSGLINWTKASGIDVIEQYRPWIKHPYYSTGTSQWYMDFDTAYSGQLSDWGPYANLGPPVVALPASSGKWVVDFWAGDSVALRGAVVGASWLFSDGQAVTSAIGSSDAPIKMTFTTASPGGRYYSLTVADNVGGSSVPHAGHRLIWAINNISEFPKIAMTDMSGGIEQGGYQARLLATMGNNGIPLSEDTHPYLDNSEIVVFERAAYGSNLGSVGGNFGHRENIIFRGWIKEKDIRVSPFSSDISLTAETISGILTEADSYDIFLANHQSGASAWTEMQGLCLDGVAQFALKWRSTLGAICDWQPMGGLGTTEQILYQSLPRAPFFEQLKENYSTKGVLGYFASDMQSNLFAFQDQNINGASATLPSVSLDGRDLRDDVIISNPARDTNAQVSLYAVTSDIPYGAESPAKVRGYFGGERVFERGLLTDSQDRLITWTGNLRAKLNSKFPRTFLPMANNMRIDPVPQSAVKMSLAASENARGITWTDKAFLTKEIDVTYDSMMGYPLWNMSVEEVVNGIGGSSITFPAIDDIIPMPTSPPSPGDISFPSVPPVTDTFGTGFGTVYFMSDAILWRTRNFSASPPVWSNIYSGSLYDFILDPWNPESTAFALTDAGVYKSTDMTAVAPSFVQMLSNADAIAATGQTFRKWCVVKGSINVAGYFMVGLEMEAGGNNVMWCVVTRDYGATWAYTSINSSAGLVSYVNHYNWLDIVPHMPAADVTAYAFVNTKLYVTTNGGTTWTLLITLDGIGNAEDTVTVHCPYNNNSNGNLVYLARADNRPATYAFQHGSYDRGTNAYTVIQTLAPASGGGVGRWSIESYTNDNQSLYLTDSQQQLWVSSDGGATLSLCALTGVSMGGTAISTLGGFPTTNSQFYMVTGGGIYVSVDRGENWVQKKGNATYGIAPAGRNVIVPLWTE